MKDNDWRGQLQEIIEQELDKAREEGRREQAELEKNGIGF